MQYRFACDWWTCAGWDGEGCPVMVRAETIEAGASAGQSDRRPGELESRGRWHLDLARNI
jgi:hypothetical protein